MYGPWTSPEEACCFHRLKEHYSGYEAQLSSLQQRYESASTEKALAALERDRALSEVYIIHNRQKLQLYVCKHFASGELPTSNTAVCARHKARE